MQSQGPYTRKQFLLCFSTMLLCMIVFIANRKPPTETKLVASNELEKFELTDEDFQDSIPSKTKITSPPPPPPPEPEIEGIFKIVEQMPIFFDCEHLENQKAQKACTDSLLLDFIYDHLQYPAIAKTKGIQGTVIVQFVVEKDGNLGDVRITQDIGAQCGAEALRVIRLLDGQKKWRPAGSRDRNVRVQYNLPVKFKL